MKTIFSPVGLLVAALTACLGGMAWGEALMRAESLARPSTTLRLGGELGRRIDANATNWLIPAPVANPAMLNMFRMRDRTPAYPDPVPWAGEFAGKYLISLIQALRLSDNPELRATAQRFVNELKETQAEDGYLGPFHKDERLLGQWDLWGHYHVMLGLYLWYKDMGDVSALETAERAADLICATYLNTGRKVLDAGWSEMNFSVIHILGILYRETGKERYADMVRQIEHEFELPGAGDYLRQALQGVEFFRTPKPRWESLHAIQGIAELYRMTGDTRYRDALAQIWRSIDRNDIHNSGSFSTNEGAVGNPFQSGSIETCCTVAWSALSLDVLQFTRDPQVADRLEQALYNAVMGYQHPSGRWSTYNTPMDGKREASAHTIVFQSRSGTPELNCCSVNAPRGLGMVSEWAMLENGNDLYLNFFGPGTVHFKDANKVDWTLEQETGYPAEGTVNIAVKVSGPAQAALHVRIPAWSKQTTVVVNGETLAAPQPGTYALLGNRTWNTGDTITLGFDLQPHFLHGDGNVGYRGSVFLGPLLLAYDQQINDFDASQIPELDAQALQFERIPGDGLTFKPMVAVRATAPGGETVNLCDFATAGAMGTYYQSWLPIKNLPPSRFELESPRMNKKVPAASAAFRWSGAGPNATYQVVVSRDAAGKEVVQTSEAQPETKWAVKEPLPDNVPLFWTVLAQNSQGTAAAANGPWPLRADPTPKSPQDTVLFQAPMDGNATPARGNLVSETGTNPAPDKRGTASAALAFDGTTGKAMYALDEFPAEEYTFLAWVKPAALSGPDAGRLHHIASAWKTSMDDPLRLTIQKGKLKAIIESGTGLVSPEVPLEEGRWYCLAVVKDGPQLTLYVDGEAKGSMAVPGVLHTAADVLAIGGNPYYTGQPEFYAGAMDNVSFHSRAFSPEEIKAAFDEGNK